MSLGYVPSWVHWPKLTIPQEAYQEEFYPHFLLSLRGIVTTKQTTFCFVLYHWCWNASSRMSSLTAACLACPQSCSAVETSEEIFSFRIYSLTFGLRDRKRLDIISCLLLVTRILTYFWLHWVSVEAGGIFCCGMKVFSCSVACGILAPQPGVESVPPALEAWRTSPLDHQGSPALLILPVTRPRKQRGHVTGRDHLWLSPLLGLSPAPLHILADKHATPSRDHLLQTARRIPKLFFPLFTASLSFFQLVAWVKKKKSGQQFN